MTGRSGKTTVARHGAAAREEARRAGIDRAHRGLDVAEIQLAEALERHRSALAAATAALGPGLGLAVATTPPVRGEALHRALGAAATEVIAARRRLADARHRLATARAARRQTP